MSTLLWTIIFGLHCIGFSHAKIAEGYVKSPKVSIISYSLHSDLLHSYISLY